MSWNSVVSDVVRRVVGGPATVAEQLRHLVAMAERPNVKIQVIGLDAGAYGTMSGPVLILGYRARDPSAAYLEHTTGGFWVDDGKDVDALKALFSDTWKSTSLWRLPVFATARLVIRAAG